ncbi:MAG: phenylacetate--CoA ligase [Candidatus Methanofastidiosa archaeon]|nr:phenylacetate--CoA ligase [Candidatus Methanofastidiosa archaeon]MDD4281023.1 phenylacetate--CoA ligase [Candidatus Methanofastidiosa archaeon]
MNDAQRLSLLKRTLSYCYDHAPHYRQAFTAAGFHPDALRSLEDLAHVPFLRKAELRSYYPTGILAVDKRRVVRYHASSGTTGSPTVVSYTKADIATWASMVADCLRLAGVGEGSVIQNSYGYGLFTGGLGLHYGAELLGASVVPTSGGNTARQVKILQDFGVDVLCCTPSYALYLSEVVAESGIDPKELPLSVGIFGAEPWSDSMRRRIEDAFDIKAYDIYGMSELGGPGVGMECAGQDGLHIWDDKYLVEVVDPETGEVLGEGEKGEIVFTSLWKEACPVIRFRTGDISHLYDSRCGCDASDQRIGRIVGRTDDMLIVRGVNVFPSQIEHVLSKIQGVSGHYQIYVERKGALDDMEVYVEVTGELFNDSMGEIIELQRAIEHEMYAVLNIKVRVRLVEPGKIPRSEGKAQRIIDRRML